MKSLKISSRLIGQNPARPHSFPKKSRESLVLVSNSTVSFTLATCTALVTCVKLVSRLVCLVLRNSIPALMAFMRKLLRQFPMEGDYNLHPGCPTSQHAPDGLVEQVQSAIGWIVGPDGCSWRGACFLLSFMCPPLPPPFPPPLFKSPLTPPHRFYEQRFSGSFQKASFQTNAFAIPKKMKTSSSESPSPTSLSLSSSYGSNSGPELALDPSVAAGRTRAADLIELFSRHERSVAGASGSYVPQKISHSSSKKVGLNRRGSVRGSSMRRLHEYLTSMDYVDANEKSHEDSRNYNSHNMDVDREEDEGGERVYALVTCDHILAPPDSELLESLRFQFSTPTMYTRTRARSASCSRSGSASSSSSQSTTSSSSTSSGARKAGGTRVEFVLRERYVEFAWSLVSLDATVVGLTRKFAKKLQRDGLTFLELAHQHPTLDQRVHVLHYPSGRLYYSVGRVIDTEPQARTSLTQHFSRLTALSTHGTVAQSHLQYKGLTLLK